MPHEPKPIVSRPSVESTRARLFEAGLDVPDAYLAGIAANLVVLQDHVATLRGFTADAAGGTPTELVRDHAARP